MKASLVIIALSLLLGAPVAEARGGGGGGHSGGGIGRTAAPSRAMAPFQSTIAIARQAATISRLRAQQATSDLITASGGFMGVGGGFERFGGSAAFGLGGTAASRAATPFQSSLAIARQAAIISRLRAQQATSDLITASGGLLGAAGRSDTFGGYGGYGGYGDFAGYGPFGVGDGGAIGSLAPAATGTPVAHMRIIAMAPTTVPPGHVEIIRGTTAEIVSVQ